MGKRVRIAILGLVFMGCMGILSIANTTLVFADPDDNTTVTNNGTLNGSDGSNSNSGGSSSSDCGDGVKTSILGKNGCYETGQNGEGIFNILAIVLNVMTFGVGAAGVLGIVISGIQYMTASGNEAQMTKAKNRIVEVVIGLFCYGLLWAFLEWLIPGGVL